MDVNVYFYIEILNIIVHSTEPNHCLADKLQCGMYLTVENIFTVTECFCYMAVCVGDKLESEI
jgi:hypothetical protein